jgi:hypothetical protein
VAAAVTSSGARLWLFHPMPIDGQEVRLRALVVDDKDATRALAGCGVQLQCFGCDQWRCRESGRELVFVDEAAEQVVAFDLAGCAPVVPAGMALSTDSGMPAASDPSARTEGV